jgi:CelD/BcsL family acetyltransferase involved in cellulose biosynthesis
MISMKRRQYIETKGIDAFETPGFEEYYREATRVLGENGPVQLCALSLDGSVLAAHWGYVTGDRFYYLMPAHEGGMWRALSPGRLLTEWQMRWCVERGLKFFDFGIGDEPYKFGYCDSRIALYDAHLPVTAKGAVYGGLKRAQAAVKSVLRETKIGGMLKAARSRIRELRPARQAMGRGYTPAVTALICSVTLAVDAA